MASITWNATATNDDIKLVKSKIYMVTLVLLLPWLVFFRRRYMVIYDSKSVDLVLESTAREALTLSKY